MKNLYLSSRLIHAKQILQKIREGNRRSRRAMVLCVGRTECDQRLAGGEWINAVDLSFDAWMARHRIGTRRHVLRLAQL